MNVLLYPLALLFALLFVCFMGLPFLFLAWLWWRLSRARGTPAVRVTVAAALAAIGVAPYVYAHGAVPVYFALFTGAALSDGMLLSLVVTFVGLLTVFGYFSRQLRGARR